MKSISFVVYEKAVGQPRPRACIRGKHAGVYDPGTADRFKADVAHAAREAAAGYKFEGPVKLFVDVSFARPKSHYKSNGELKPFPPTWHVSKPDLDNIVKAVEDAITKSGIWTDDSLVVRITASKRWGKGNATEIAITEHVE